MSHLFLNRRAWTVNLEYCR